jgi:formylmethanofuran dehydrogenase subunit D
MPRTSWLPRDDHLKKKKHKHTHNTAKVYCSLDDGDFKDIKTKEGDKEQITKNAREL